jgi:hypothetical protein
VLEALGSPGWLINGRPTRSNGALLPNLFLMRETRAPIRLNKFHKALTKCNIVIGSIRTPILAELSPWPEAAIGWGWLDLVCTDMEGQGYTCGTTVLPACSVGAPHIRQRLWFVKAPASRPYPKGTPRTSLCQQSNRSLHRRNGNWKTASRDRRPKPAPKGPKCRKLPTRDWGTPA